MTHLGLLSRCCRVKNSMRHCKELLSVLFVLVLARGPAHADPLPSRLPGLETTANRLLVFLPSDYGDKRSAYVDVSQHGADNTGASDSQPSFASAVQKSNGRPLYVGPGIFRLDDMVTLGSGQILQCAGRTLTTLKIDVATFNQSAPGVIRLGTKEPGAQVFDCGVDFVQPNTVTRENVIRYPPAFYAVDTPRFVLDRVRVSNGWACLDATRNTGGAQIGTFECGGVSSVGAILFDGARDGIHIDNIHCWPFGMSESSIYKRVWLDGNTVCARFGRVDGLSVNNIMAFASAVKFDAPFRGSSAGLNIGSLQLDAMNARLECSAGKLQVGQIYSTKDEFGVTPSIRVSGSCVATVGDYRGVSSQLRSDVVVTSGELHIHGGWAQFLDTQSSFASVQSTGLLDIANFRVVTAPKNRTAAFFSQAGRGAILRLSNVMSSPSQGATGYMVEFSDDNANNLIANSTFPGWKHKLSFPTSVGRYNFND
jgi:hypothetical protein